MTEIKKMNMKEIMTRKAEIEKLISGDEEFDINKLTTEVDELNEREKEINEMVEKRNKLIENVKLNGIVIPKEEGEGMPENRTYAFDSPEYRSTWLKNLRGNTLTDIEKRSLTSAESSVGSTIPTTLQNKIYEKINQFAPILEHIDVLSVAGGIDLSYEGVVSEAIAHKEGEKITPGADTTIKVSLGGHEVVKLLKISNKVKQMSITAFESWLVNNVSKSVAKKIRSLVISGTGTGEAQGIETGVTWTEENSVGVAKAGTLTAANVRDAESKLAGGYDDGAMYLMSKKTFFQDFLPLQDNSKNSLVVVSGKEKSIDGYPVLFDDGLALNLAYLGNFFEGYKANLVEDVGVRQGFDFDTNQHQYLGSAIFDGKVADKNAFVKIHKKLV